MGSTLSDQLDDYWDAEAKERQNQFYDPDESGPVGSRQQFPFQHTATLIVLDKRTMRLVYDREVPLEVYLGKEEPLSPELQRLAGMSSFRAWLFQTRARSPKLPNNREAFQLLRDATVVLSKVPHSRNYFTRATLKKTSYDVERNLSRHLVPLLAEDRFMCISPDVRLGKAIEEMRFTPFVSHKDCHAAWASQARTFPQLIGGRSDSVDEYCLGVLPADLLPDSRLGVFETAVELLKSEPIVETLFEKTLDGQLFANFLNTDQLRKAHAPSAIRGPVARQVTPELMENREELMEAAIWGALSGRMSLEVPQKRSRVSKQLKRLYVQFAYNFVARQEKKGQPKPDYVPFRGDLRSQS